ncbi:MAG: gliding motility-associated C-terminal domain-containing protein, partial [Pedobacter sp.]
HRGTISVTVSLPSGVTTAVPLDISLVQGSGSILSGVPAPVFPSDAFIGANSGVGYINVSGSNMRDDDVPAVLILEGSSTGFKVNPGTITIYNKRIHAFMSVSANGDNIHDYSEIQNIEKYLDNEVDIIDRWGVLVWRVKGYNNQDNVFRGRSNQGNGYDLPEGTYYYVIRFYDETGEINIFKGSLQLKRGTTGQ